VIDALTYLAPSFAFSSSFHLVSTSNPLYSRLEPGKIWYPKNPVSMMPGDLNTFDDQWIYQKLTEQDWSSPKSFKAFVSSNWPGGGIPLCPRQIDEARPLLPVITMDSSFRIYSDCSTFMPQNLQQVQTRVIGPSSLALGGDLGTVSCLIIEYQWNNGQTMETFAYAQTFGWVHWATANLVNGRYVTQKTVTFNSVVVGGYAGAKFPCAIP
jgi:hypothetical protein